MRFEPKQSRSHVLKHSAPPPPPQCLTPDSIDPTLYQVVWSIFPCCFLTVLEFSVYCLSNHSDTPQRQGKSFLFLFYLAKGLVTKGRPQSISEETPLGLSAESNANNKHSRVLFET